MVINFHERVRLAHLTVAGYYVLWAACTAFPSGYSAFALFIYINDNYDFLLNVQLLGTTSLAEIERRVAWAADLLGLAAKLDRLEDAFVTASAQPRNQRLGPSPCASAAWRSAPST